VNAGRPDDLGRGHLSARSIGTTVDRLAARIVARFPDRHLVLVAGDLAEVLADVTAATENARRWRRLVRLPCLVLAAAVAAATGLALILSIQAAVGEAGGTPAFQWLPVLESGINDVVFAGIAIWFLVFVPERWHRRRTLTLLHRLRSLAHIIDMHQLTKDPERLSSDTVPTSASAHNDLGASELGRYLDYCSELLSLVGKTAALCAQATSDAVVLDTVSEIETLTVGMSRKIWQKISLLPTFTQGPRS
jgi:hypothetical protein